MNKEILRLAIPNIISNISVPVLSAVDVALMGHLASTQELGAIAVGVTIFNVLYWGFGFLRMSTTGMTAQVSGAKKQSQSIAMLEMALKVALVSGFLLILLQPVISVVSFRLIEASNEVEYLAKKYFGIRILAAPATLMLYCFHGWFLGMQNARIPMFLVIITNLSNIILNLVLVMGLGMKVDGVALGTVISQYIGLIMAVVLFWYHYRHLWQYRSSHRVLWRRFFFISGDIVIRTLSLVLCHAFFTSKSASLGDQILAVNTLLLQFISLLAFAVDGFAFAAECLIGKYKGEANQSQLNRAIRYTFLWGYAFGLFFSFAFWLIGTKILYLFTDQPNLIQQANQYFIWVIIAPILNVAAYVWDGIYLGASASQPMRNAMVFSAVVIFFPTYYLLIQFGNHGLWTALMLFTLSRGLTLTLLSRKHILGHLT